jgi:hypothetical protein
MSNGTQNEVVIEWDYPHPKNGLDRFAGPGATRAEILLQFGGAFAAIVAVVLGSYFSEVSWSALQVIVAAVLAMDVVGGIITNATGAGKRWYHRSGQGARQHLGFVLLHIVQPLIVFFVFDSVGWSFVAGGFGFLLLSAVIVLVTPLYLQRPMAGALIAVGITLSLYLFPAPTGMEWFLPLYYVKLLSSHLLREEPYRPRKGSE